MGRMGMGTRSRREKKRKGNVRKRGKTCEIMRKAGANEERGGRGDHFVA
jgi:hypothetical protein